MHARGRLARLLGPSKALILLAGLLALMLAPGMKGRMFRAREWNGGEAELRHPDPANLTVQPPQLVHLSPGVRLESLSPPAGWTSLIMKSIPSLSTGDLDTVAARSFETAQKIRPFIVADVRRSSGGEGAGYHLARVGVGLCAPGEDGTGDVVVSPTALEGTRGSWTAKERFILAAMALEVSRSHIAAATSTFALLRSPNTYLVGGSHLQAETSYGLFVDPRTGALQILVWHQGVNSGTAEDTTLARLLEAPVFDCPLDVHASRVLGTPVAWSFAIRELPPGRDVLLPADLVNALDRSSEGSLDASSLEAKLRGRLETAK